MTQAEQIYLKHFSSLDREILYETGDETQILAAIQEALDTSSTQLAAKEKEFQQLREALENLVQLKRWKDKHGKDEHYVRNVDAAWQKAFEVFPIPATPAIVDTSAAIHPSTKNLHQ